MGNLKDYKASTSGVAPVLTFDTSWPNDTFEATTITAPGFPTVVGTFVISTPTATRYFWLNPDGAGVDPGAPIAYPSATGVQVACLSSENNYAIATRISNAFNSLGMNNVWNHYAAADKVYIDCMDPGQVQVPPADIDAGVVLTVTTTGTSWPTQQDVPFVVLGMLPGDAVVAITPTNGVASCYGFGTPGTDSLVIHTNDGTGTAIFRIAVSRA
jgi:hypothetical protein